VVPANFRQPERLTSARLVVIDRAESPAGHAVLALIGVSRRASEYLASMMAIDIFNQLLAQANLAATAKAEARVLNGPLTIETSAPVGQLIEQVKSITALMTRMKAQPPTLEQVEAAKARMIAAMGERLRDPAATSDLILEVESYGLGRDYVLRYAERVNAVTPADIQAAASALLRPEAMAVALSGPAGQLESDARRLGTVTVIR
jgi:zinc protease